MSDKKRERNRAKDGIDTNISDLCDSYEDEILELNETIAELKIENDKLKQELEDSEK